MKTKEATSDFLTNQQRIKFVFVTLPFLNLFIIAIGTYTSSDPWLSLGIGLLTPIIGSATITYGRKTRNPYYFAILAIILNGLVAAAFCAVSGPDSPSFIIGMAYIGACTILLDKIRQIIFFIAVGFIEIIVGSFIAGRSQLDIIIGVMILICYSIILVRFMQFILKQGTEIVSAMDEITLQKELIEEKNQSITDSINYALRIQQAMLPEKQSIYSVLTKCFILFKPKDIVSGDFYFFHQKEQFVYIAAADCTGHGVPGAMMSMIGIEKLQDTLINSEEPSEILQQLNKRVKTSLKQTDSDDSTRDGMDIALCKIDLKTRTINYAGANRSFWLIHSGQTTIEEIKATKKAIGGLTADDAYFESHTLQLQAGDTFYIFTDGYADTFGGKTNKKLTTKKFKELLLKGSKENMQDQESHLDRFIEDWKADTEQVDDILVIGVRL